MCYWLPFYMCYHNQRNIGGCEQTKKSTSCGGRMRWVEVEWGSSRVGKGVGREEHWVASHVLISLPSTVIDLISRHRSKESHGIDGSFPCGK